MKKSSPSIIPLSYDYQKVSPSAASNRGTHSDATTTFYDNQYQSLFGDPVPPTPSEDYLGHLDGSLYGSFRRDSYASAIADDFNRTITLAAESSNGKRLSRLFSETPVTSTSMGLSPQLAPDIQILPGSGSGGNSSSDARDSPNYALLRPDATNLPLVNDTYDQMQDVASSGMQDYVEQERAAKEVTRRISDFSEDFKSNVGSLRESPPEIPEPPSRYTRQISNESYSSTEWFKPINTYSEFTKMPKLRPSSKNVLSIKHLEMPPEDSPVAAMIHDSNGSSSGDDQRKLDAVPARPPDPPPSRLKSLQRQSTSIDSALQSIPSPPSPPPLPAPLTLSPPEPVPPPPIVRQMSPIILTDAITTGAEHRVTAPRTHKKTSFTIIAEKSPQSSRATSPRKLPQPGRISPFRGHGFREPEKPVKFELSEMPQQKPIAKPRMLQQKSFSTTHLKLPSISGPASNSVLADDSPRPSVQFNMSGNRMPMPMTHQKGILQMGKDPSSSSQETPLSNQIDLLTQRNKIQSCEALPLITDPYRTAIPRLSAPTAPTRPIIPNPNPTRKQRGLLRVINSADSNSRIPVRSNWASMDDLSVQRKPILSPIRIKARRRSSSTSPERRSSTQTEPRSSIASDRRSSNLSSVTTSDFSFRRGSLSLIKSSLVVRRKSTFQSTRISHSTPASPSNRLRVTKTPRKVAKPTTLSPIIGTPNKDLPQTSTSESQPVGFSLSRRESLSKIPVRNSPIGSSRSNSRLSSRANSRVSSRSSSPFKDFGINSRVPSSRSPSRQTLRSDSKLTSRGGSRPVSRAASSRAPSRSTSRASTRQASRGVSRANSRASTRPNSRMDQAKAIANSRSTSRLSSRSDSPIKSRRESPSKTNHRVKSSSHSPALKKPRRKSKSPVKTKTLTPVPKRKNSRSLIPSRVPTTKSSPQTNVSIKTRPRRDSPKRTSVRKQPISAKKLTAPSSIPKGGTKSSTKPGVKKPSEATDSRRTPVPAKKSTSKSYTPAPDATPTGLKSRQASNLQAPNSQKPTAALKREPPSPSVRQAIIAAAKLKKEASSASIRRAEAISDQSAPSNEQESLTVENSQSKEGSSGGSKSLKRQPSTLTLISVGSKLNLLRKRSESNLSKKLEESKQNAESGDENAAADGGADATTNGKLVALTKTNVVSMTTAAITAHPVQISTVLTNQLPKTNSSGQLLAGQEDMAIPAAILEKSQKTLENIQKTVTEATDEIQKTINENLTDLKILESDIGKLSEELGAGSPQPFEKSDSLTTIIEKQSQASVGEKVATAAAEKVTNNIDDAFGEAIRPIYPIDATVKIINPKDIAHQTTNKGHGSSNVTEAAVHSGTTGGLAATEDSTERVSEHTISVLPEVDCESANLQSNKTRLISEEEETTTGHTGEEGQLKTTSTKQNSVGTNNAVDVSNEGVIQKE